MSLQLNNNFYPIFKLNLLSVLHIIARFDLYTLYYIT